MKVTFVKKGSRRYAVEVRRDRYPDLWCGSIGYDDELPHDLLHFVGEAESASTGASSAISPQGSATRRGLREHPFDK